jgi:hypothetical protein
MINMKDLNLLTNNDKITNEGIIGMINMQKLNVHGNNKITNDGIK